MKKVTVVITDLDNTLFDWVRIWYESFSAMLDELVRTSGIEKGVLIRDIKNVFTQRGTSEYAFVIQEIEALRARFPGENLPERFDSAVHAYRSARKRVMELYPDVEETLQVLKDKGVLIVGYTESQAFYTHYRMRSLGLDRILDFVYSPPDHDLPQGLTPQQIRTLSPEYYQLRRTEHRHTPPGALKPNPGLLLRIVHDIGAVPDEVIYVGDNQMKDVLMAQEARITDVWAEYGFAVERPEYELLRDVTHWSTEAVDKEKEILRTPPSPSYTLKCSFRELLTLFDFGPFVDLSEKKVSILVEAWKKTVDVQQHFNDLEMRIRNYGLTLVTAAIAAATLAFREHLQVHLCGLSAPLGAVGILAITPIWLCFYMMDRFWYHQFLVGAVNHGLSIERRLHSVFPEFGLAESISRASPSRICGCQIHSSRKIDLFYGVIALILLVAAVCAGFQRTESATSSKQQSAPASSTDTAGSAPARTGAAASSGTLTPRRE